MSVNSIPSANQYLFTGTSADTKPVVAVQPGSLFTETDTLNQFIFGSDYAWHPYYSKTGMLDGSGNPISSSGGALYSAMFIWQPSTLSYIHASADASGNLNTTGSGGGGGGTVTANQGTSGTDPWLFTPQQYAFQFDSSANPVLYLGEAATGSATSAAVWRIQKINTASGVQITWAGGSASFTNVWNNRASLSYS
jgi:hypothetical protein